MPQNVPAFEFSDAAKALRAFVYEFWCAHGRGPNLRDIQTAFMASPSHRENIVDPGFTQLGVGVTWDGKEYFYVAVIFRTPSNENLNRLAAE